MKHSNFEKEYLMTYTLFQGYDPFNKLHYLLRIWSDGTHELATRRSEVDSWGPAVDLRPEPVSA